LQVFLESPSKSEKSSLSARDAAETAKQIALRHCKTLAKAYVVLEGWTRWFPAGISSVISAASLKTAVPALT
jgi:hypothetical protein